MTRETCVERTNLREIDELVTLALVCGATVAEVEQLISHAYPPLLFSNVFFSQSSSDLFYFVTEGDVYN